MRFSWVDMAKGFAIILVVFGHVWRGVDLSGLLERELFRAVDARIYAFHMPLFFLISGLFFTGGLKKQNVVRFLQSRVVRLIYPLLLWTYIFIASKLAAGTMSNAPIGWEELLKSPVPGRWHFWFLWALFVIHISMVLVRPVLVSERYQNAGLLGLLALSAALNTVSISGEIGFWLGSAVRNLLYFVIGMNIGRYFMGVRISWLSCLLAAVVFAGILYWLPQIYRITLPQGVTATPLILSVTVVFIWLGGKGGPVLAALSYIGQRSMAIFLAHVIFTAGIREVLLQAGINSVAVHLLLGTGFGLILPMIMYGLAQRWSLSRLLGF